MLFYIGIAFLIFSLEKNIFFKPLNTFNFHRVIDKELSWNTRFLILPIL